MLTPIKNNKNKLTNKIAIYRPAPWLEKTLVNIASTIASDIQIIQRNNNKLKLDAANLLWGKARHKDLIAKHTTAKIWSIEDGFIRSNGLGRHFYLPHSLCIDTQGIYFDTTTPSDLEDHLNNYNVSKDEINTGKEILNLITKLNINKYNINPKKNINLYKSKINKKIILIIGQVEDDESIQLGCNNTKNNLDLIKAVKNYNNDAYLIYKPHPDVLYSNRLGKVKDNIAMQYVNHIEKKASVINCIKFADEVHTMTSLAGMESLIYKKPVVTWGKPFYGGWGLTQDMEKYERRNRKLTLEELVYIVYELYPIYWDHEENNLSNAINTIKKLSIQKSPAQIELFSNKFYLFSKNILKKLIQSLIKNYRK